MIEDYEKAKSTFETLKENLQRQVGVRNSLQEKYESLKDREGELFDKATTASEGLSFVEGSVQGIRNRTFRSIETVTNEALQVVYGANLRIECDFGIKRDRSAVEIMILKDCADGTKLKRKPEGSGCGVSDVVSLCLRMVLIRATGSVPILIADEPFKWLGRDQIPQATKLLKHLSEKLNMQIIATSHHPTMREMADKSFWLELNEEDESKIISIEGA